MIQSKELREGNIINYLGKAVVVNVNIIHAVKRIVHPSEMYTPIPLSPDILERCLGVQAHFGKLLRVYSFDISNGSGYKTISLTVEEGNQYIYLRQGDLKSERHNDAVITIYNADVRGPIMLHYFQNLFIDLTGEELTITL